eukprot:TRINITY_DN1311_c0_g1_i11.p1 TRINITY_DN1311_c0_g1~~TRINITY_DN1311_c0_g1_i11.p1  ORF type:complete len:470 (-),score=142.49 TRINITY_DN1311_c0_g1_i11:1573-2982(-)
MTGGTEMNNAWPQDVGILAMEIYFPAQFVDQAELESHDGVSSGKYTIGLGQTRMGFCTDREDINSLCLTVVNRLLEKTGTDYSQIGRLEVGTETLVDKSKSVKSVLMQLFADSGNTDLEGIDCTNACYGGTAALFNSVNWVESSAWDGRLALAVCGDIAVYAAGAARPSGGAGAVAMLVGPNAPLVLERGLRSSHMQHVYDFYKPDMSSEYPAVDAPLSIQCYLSSLDTCYARYRSKVASKDPKQQRVTLDTFNALLFHTPYCKLVQKSLARLALNDFVAEDKEARLAQDNLKQFADVQLDKTYFDRDVEKAFMAHSQKQFEAKTKPSLYCATNIGNMYTPSLYGGLVSHLVVNSAATLAGQRIALFSYGSGLASTFFSIRITEDTGRLDKLLAVLADVKTRLESRKKLSPADFVATLETREKAVHASPYTPCGPTDTMFPGTWYLQSIDDKHRRQYSRSEPAQQVNGH